MLIDSPRITAADRTIWKEHESADLFVDWQPHAAVACDIIACFCRDPCFVAVSWGKDSVCVAHLVLLVNPGVPLFHVRTRRQNPDCDRVRDVFLSQFTCDYHEIPEPPEAWPHWGHGLRKIPFTRSIHGVRASESGQRALSAAVHGCVTAKMARPLLRWKAEVVFAYLAFHGLPVHPAYAMTGGGRWQRERIRVGTLGGERGAGIGRAEWEREYYGDVLRRLEHAARA